MTLRRFTRADVDDTFFEQWPEPIEGAEHGDVEYALTRETWTRQHDH